MHFEVKGEHSNLQFPARLTFDKSWDDALALSLNRIRAVTPNARALIACTPSQADKVACAIGAGTLSGPTRVSTWRSCDEESLAKLDEACARQSTSVLVALGGGAVIDLCKLVAIRRNVILIVIPSVLSSDCIASPIAVLRNESGSRACSAAMPNEIVIDRELVTTAPNRSFLAGVGDLLSNSSALAEMREDQSSGKSVSDFAMLLSETSVSQFTSAVAAIDDMGKDAAVELAKGLILSGMAMGFAGNSSPCSGSEHLISHALDRISPGKAMHGEQVGLATVFVQELRRRHGMPVLPNPVISILRGMCGFTSPEKFGFMKDEFLQAVEMASEVRPGRVPFWAGMAADMDAAFDAAFPHATALVSN